MKMILHEMLYGIRILQANYPSNDIQKQYLQLLLF